MWHPASIAEPAGTVLSTGVCERDGCGRERGQVCFRGMQGEVLAAAREPGRRMGEQTDPIDVTPVTGVERRGNRAAAVLISGIVIGLAVSGARVFFLARGPILGEIATIGDRAAARNVSYYPSLAAVSTADTLFEVRLDYDAKRKRWAAPAT